MFVEPDPHCFGWTAFLPRSRTLASTRNPLSSGFEIAELSIDKAQWLLQDHVDATYQLLEQTASQREALAENSTACSAKVQYYRADLTRRSRFDGAVRSSHDN